MYIQGPETNNGNVNKVTESSNNNNNNNNNMNSVKGDNSTILARIFSNLLSPNPNTNNNN